MKILEQVGGKHYKKMKMQPTEYILANDLGFCEGNIVKYISRWRNKNGIEDLEKIIHYCNILINFEVEKNRLTADCPNLNTKEPSYNIHNQNENYEFKNINTPKSDSPEKVEKTKSDALNDTLDEFGKFIPNPNSNPKIYNPDDVTGFFDNVFKVHY